MAFVVNKENPIESLSFDQLDAILSTTHARGGKPITKWGQLGVVGPLATQNIKIYGIQPWNGFEEFIRQRVLSYNGTRGQCRPSHPRYPHFSQANILPSRALRQPNRQQRP